MAKASEIAAALSKLAEHYQSLGDVEVEAIYIPYYHPFRESFIAAVKAMPKPITKEYRDDEIRCYYKVPGLTICNYASRDNVCRVVEPAKPAVYECEPLLSPEEESALTE